MYDSLILSGAINYRCKTVYILCEDSQLCICTIYGGSRQNTFWYVQCWGVNMLGCWADNNDPWGGWGCEVSCGGHHQQRGKTTTGSALDGAVLDLTQILAHLVHNMSISQLYLGFGHFGWPPSFSINNILASLWLNCISSVDITLFLLADISLQHRSLFQC